MSGPNQVLRLLLAAAGASPFVCVRDDIAPSMILGPSRLDNSPVPGFNILSPSTNDQGVSLAINGSQQIGKRVAANGNNLLDFSWIDFQPNQANTTGQGGDASI